MRTQPINLAFVGDTTPFYFNGIFKGFRNYCLTEPAAELFHYLGKSSFSPTVFKHVSAISGVLTNYSPEMVEPHFPSPELPVIYCSGNFWNNAVVRIQSDDVLGGRMAAGHLIQKGVASTLAVLPLATRFAELRMQGFLAECAVKSIPASTFTLDVEAPGDPGLYRQSLEAAERAFLKQVVGLPQPVGIFVTNDYLAIHVLDLLKAARLKVPQAFKVIGFDDCPDCTSSRPTLSSVAPDSYQIGFLAGQLLTRWIQGGTPPPRETRVAPFAIHERESSGGKVSSDPHINKLIVWISRSLDQPIGIDDFVAHSGYSRRSLEKHFRSELGTSPYQYLTEMRINRAKKLLRETKLPIESIARQTGFDNLNAIGMAFRRRVGQSPSRYRKIHRR